MRYVFRAIVFLLSLHLLCSAIGSAEAAKLKKIIVVKKGEALQTNDTTEMGMFVYFGKDDQGIAINKKEAYPNEEVYVAPGANLLMDYAGNDFWIGYNSHVRIGEDKVEGLSGEFYLLGEKRFFDFSKVRILAASSEYYVEVKADGAAVLYVVKGHVEVQHKETGRKTIVEESKAIDESLEKKRLSDEKIKRIHMWRDNLGLSFAPLAVLSRLIKRHPWAAAGVTAAGLGGGYLIKKYIVGSDPSSLHITLELVELP